MVYITYVTISFPATRTEFSTKEEESGDCIRTKDFQDEAKLKFRVIATPAGGAGTDTIRPALTQKTLKKTALKK